MPRQRVSCNSASEAPLHMALLKLEYYYHYHHYYYYL